MSTVKWGFVAKTVVITHKIWIEIGTQFPTHIVNFIWCVLSSNLVMWTETINQHTLQFQCKHRFRLDIISIKCKTESGNEMNWMAGLLLLLISLFDIQINFRNKYETHSKSQWKTSNCIPCYSWLLNWIFDTWYFLHKYFLTRNRSVILILATAVDNLNLGSVDECGKTNYVFEKHWSRS